jgi:CheY-like chemotaxis protein
MAAEIKGAHHPLNPFQRETCFKRKHARSKKESLVQAIRVLYVEDQGVFRKLIQKTGERFQWVLTLASTGQEGVALARDHEYDIILMDIILGEESHYDGYEAARRIKEIKPHHTIVSFSTSPMEERRAKGSIMDGHLEKNPSPCYLQIALSPFLFPSQKVDKKRRVDVAEKEETDT